MVNVDLDAPFRRPSQWPCQKADTDSTERQRLKTASMCHVYRGQSHCTPSTTLPDLYQVGLPVQSPKRAKSRDRRDDTLNAMHVAKGCRVIPRPACTVGNKHFETPGDDISRHRTRHSLPDVRPFARRMTRLSQRRRCSNPIEPTVRPTDRPIYRRSLPDHIHEVVQLLLELGAHRGLETRNTCC